MRLGPAYGLAAAGFGLAACGPVPVEQAERQCYAQYAPRAPISGTGTMGVTNEGLHTRMELNLDIGTQAQGDPAAAYDACVYRKSGRMPTRPFYSY